MSMMNEKDRLERSVVHCEVVDERDEETITLR